MALGMEESLSHALSGKRLTIFGCGYLGLAVASEAVARGMHVAALTRNESAAEQARQAGVREVVIANLQDSGWHRSLPCDSDYVLNCVSSAGGGVAGYRSSYVDGQASILQWLQGGSVGTYVYTGATSVYPQSDGSWVDEAASHEGVSASASILLEAEALLRAARIPTIGRWFILRLAGIYGPGRHFLLDRLRQGNTVFAGHGEHYLNLIHRDDIVAAVWRTFSAPARVANRIYNVADGNPATRARICDWLAEQTGLGRAVFDPTQEGRRGSSRKGASGALPNRRIDISRIRSELGWSPRYADFEQGFSAIMRDTDFDS